IDDFVADFLKIKRSKIRHLSISTAEVNSIELRGSGVSGVADIDELELAAVKSVSFLILGCRTSVRLTSCTIANLDLKQVFLQKGSLSGCSVNFREVQGATFTGITLSDSVLTTEDHKSLEQLQCVDVLFDRCV